MAIRNKDFAVSSVERMPIVVVKTKKSRGVHGVSPPATLSSSLASCRIEWGADKNVSLQSACLVIQMAASSGTGLKGQQISAQG